MLLCGGYGYTIGVLEVLIIINFLYLNQLSWPGQHRRAGERGSKQPRGTLLSLVVPELSEHQVGGRDWSPLWPRAPQF